VSTSIPPERLLDVGDTWDQARALPTAPLIVREGLQRVLHTDELPEVTRINAGHSNATFFLRTPQLTCILRRPPRPPFEPKAHDVLREHRFLAALRNRPVRAPIPLLACRDTRVIGAPFYLMEALDGVALRDQLPPQLDCAAGRARIGDELIDALIELHSVEPHELRLGDPATGRNYLVRQIELWRNQWERNRTRPVPALDEVTERLRKSVPVPQRLAVVHGDYKLDNVLFTVTPTIRLQAILDWEMATVGDPLADLGFLTATWNDPGDPPDRLNGLSTASINPGFPTRRELAARYRAQSGLDLTALAWYQALALWKLAILLEASYTRFLAGTTADRFLGTLESGIPRIADAAMAAAKGVLV